MDGAQRVPPSPTLLSGNTKSVIEGVPVLDGEQLCLPIQRDRESVHKADLADQHRPRWTPVSNEADLGLPLDELIIRCLWRVKPEGEIEKAGRDRLAAYPETDLFVATVRIDPDCRG